MSTWQRFFGRLVTEIDRQPHTPPGFPPLDDTPAAVELEHQARHTAALRLITAVLEQERAKPQGFRDVGRFDLALDMRSILLPAPADAEVLREATPERVS